MSDKRLAKWERWLKGDMPNSGSIEAEVFRMNRHRHVRDGLVRITKDNGTLPPSYLFEFIDDIYADSQVSAVRRLADRDPQAASLANLIAEVAESPALITRDAALARAGHNPDPLAVLIIDEQFTQLAGTGEHLAPEIPAADLAELSVASAKVKRYVDRHVAHSDKRPVDTSRLPTLAEVHGAVELASELFKKYAAFVYGGGHTRLHDVPDDWTRVLRQPWLNRP